MAKTKVSEWSSTAASNTDIDSINIAEGCAPSGINDAIRELMSQIKDFQAGTAGDSFNGPVGTSTAAAGAFTTLTTSSTVTHNGGTANGVAYLNGSKVLTTGSGLVFDGSNLGLGVTPSAWNTGWKAADIGRAAVASPPTTTSTSVYATNAFLNTSGSWIYKSSDFASSYVHSDGQHRWNTAASGTAGNAISFTQAMTLDASGNLGIGTSSPSARLEVADTTSAAATALVQFTGQNGYEMNLQSLTTTNSTVGARYNFAVNSSNGEFSWSNSGGERARIDSSGNLLVGTTDVNDSSTGFKYNNTRDGAGHPRLVLSDSGTTNTYVPLGVYSTGASAYRFYVGAGGTIYATSTTITAISSDQRLKQDIVDYDKGLAEVLALRPRYFAYKKEPDRKLSGFISQEVQTVLPDAIEPTLEDPEMLTYSIDWHPLLVKAIQEQQAIIEQLKADVAALKGA